MRAVIQKSGKAFVEINGKIVGQIESGLVILLGITNTDTAKDIDYLADKIINIRLFPDNEKYFEKSVLEEKKEILLISQFTLYAGTKKGRRPDFIEAAKGDVAEPLYNQFIEKLQKTGLKIATGIFGAMMNITLTNEGPVTIILDTRHAA